MSRHPDYSIVDDEGAEMSASTDFPSPYQGEVYRDTQGFSRPLSQAEPKEASLQHSSSSNSPSPGFWAEAGCFLFSVGSFSSVIAILSLWQNQPLSRWSLPVSINAIVSVLSAIFKASLVMPVSEGINHLKWLWFVSGRRPLSDIDVFDRASRGPWGSFRLLMGPFQSRRDISPKVAASLGAFVVLVAIATDPFSQALIQFYSCPQPSPIATERAGIPRINAFDQPDNLHSPDRPLQIAAFKGLIDPPVNSSSNLKITCPTGNCRFPSAPGSGASFSTLALCPHCTDISHRAEKLTNGSYLLDEGTRLLLVDSSTPLATHSPDSFRDFGRPMVINLTTFPVAQQANFPYRAALLISNSTLRDGIQVPCTSSSSTSSPSPHEATTTNSTLSFPPECIHSATGGALAAINLLLNWRFDERVSPFTGRLKLNRGQVNSSSGEFWLHTLWDGGFATAESVTSFVEGWARSISAEMREFGNDTTRGGGFAWGEVVREETCIGVQWGFLGFLGGLLALEAAFGVVVLVVSWGVKRRGGWNGDWKSSAMALVVAGLDEDVRREVSGAGEGAGSMYKRGEGVLVRLEKDMGGWKFRGRTLEPR